MKDEDFFGRVVQGVRLEKVGGKKRAYYLLTRLSRFYEEEAESTKDQTRVGAVHTEVTLCSAKRYILAEGLHGPSSNYTYPKTASKTSTFGCKFTGGQSY